MKRIEFTRAGGGFCLLLLALLSSTGFICNCPPTCGRGFVFWHAKFSSATDEYPKLILEKNDGTLVMSDEEGGGGKPCNPPGSCGKSFDCNGVATGTYRAFATYKGKRYYYTGSWRPITTDGPANAATFLVEPCKSTVLEMVVELPPQ